MTDYEIGMFVGFIHECYMQSQSVAPECPETTKHWGGGGGGKTLFVINDLGHPPCFVCSEPSGATDHSRIQL